MDSKLWRVMLRVRSLLVALTVAKRASCLSSASSPKQSPSPRMASVFCSPVCSSRRTTLAVPLSTAYMVKPESPCSKTCSPASKGAYSILSSSCVS